jgi:hypothetical protein
MNVKDPFYFFDSLQSLHGTSSVVLQTSCAPLQRIWLYEWQTQSGIENLTVTCYQSPDYVNWIPSSGIRWSVTCYKFADVSEKRAASVFGNCMQHDPTKRTQISTSLHGIIYRQCVLYVVLSAAWIIVIKFHTLISFQFSHSTWNTVINLSWIENLRYLTVYVTSTTNFVHIYPTKRKKMPIIDFP